MRLSTPSDYRNEGGLPGNRGLPSTKEGEITFGHARKYQEMHSQCPSSLGELPA
jgi:hypothetical protein